MHMQCCVIREYRGTDRPRIAGDHYCFSAQRLTMKLLVGDIRQIKTAIPLHFLDDNTVTLAAKGNSTVALNHQGDCVLRAIYDSTQLEIAIDLDVCISVTANEQVILLYITFEHQRYLLLSSLSRLLHFLLLNQAIPV